MTTAEKFREFQNSPAIKVAAYIFQKDVAEIAMPLANYVKDIRTGKTPSKAEKRYYEDEFFDWFKPDEIGGDIYLKEAKAKVSKYACERGQVTEYEPNTLLINCIGDVGRISILKKKASSNQQITGIKFVDDVLLEYAFFYLISNRDFFTKDLFATTLPIINQKKLNAIPFKKPSKANQEKIVKYIFDLIDFQENRKTALPEYNQSVDLVAKKIVLTYQSKTKLLNELTHQQTLLTRLRQSILQEAVQGQLTAHWRQANPNQEPASELLRRIQAEKAALIENRIIKEGNKQAPETLNELMFEIPETWTWIDLDDITQYITDGTHQTPSYKPKGRIFLSAQNVKPFKFMPEDHKFISEEAYQEIVKNKFAEKGDILVARVGAGIGEAAVIDREIEFGFYVSLGLVKTFKALTNSEYLTLVFNSPFGVNYSKGNISSKGGSAGNFNLGRIRSFPIPLPPLPEQAAIVAQVERLLGLVGQLEAEAAGQRVQAEGLLQAALREAMG